MLPVVRIPDIESQRARGEVEVLGFATSPSDVVAFHQAALHGGGSCLRGERRRTIALRFVGPDCWKSERAGGIMEASKQGGRQKRGLAGVEDGAPAAASALVLGTERGEERFTTSTRLSSLQAKPAL